MTPALIVASVLVFVYELTLGPRALDRFVLQWGVVPQDLFQVIRTGRNAGPELVTLISSQFIHGGFAHLGGNMLFLWVFGRAVERRIGSWLYLPFYLMAGILAAVVQAAIGGPAETIPLIGASGAIAGVLGAYLYAYPRAWVSVLVPVLFFFWRFDLPAMIVLGLWFAIQVFNGVASITTAAQAGGGVAFWAHVAGFVAGFGAARLMPARGATGRGRAVARHSRDEPGPLRLVSSMANLVLLLLVVRILVLALALGQPGTAVATLVIPILVVTDALVFPIALFVRPWHLGPLLLDTAAFATMVTVMILAAAVGSVLGRRR